MRPPNCLQNAAAVKPLTLPKVSLSKTVTAETEGPTRSGRGTQRSSSSADHHPRLTDEDTAI